MGIQSLCLNSIEVKGPMDIEANGPGAHVSIAPTHTLVLYSFLCIFSLQGVDSLTNPSSSSPGPWHCLQRLVLSYNSLGPLAGPALARMLQCCPALQELQVVSCGLTKAVLDSHTGLQEALHGEQSKLVEKKA